jgi:peptide/nickel transport system substrate-binding protein
MVAHRGGILALLTAMLLLTGGPAQAGGTLRWALDQDPDALDPAVSGSYGDRIVTNWMCDQLLDVNAKLDFVPALATAWEWSPDGLMLTLKLRDGVVFQDGEPFTSDAVKANILRYQNAPESLRKAELRPVIAVETPDRLTAKFILSRPYAPLLSLLANRPGTMMSPRILGKTRDEIVANPVCSGPYKFTQRVAQDRIVLDRFAGHWNNAAMGPDRVIFLSMVDSTIRLVNLQSGQIDIHNRVAPTDVQAVKKDPKLRLLVSPSLGFQLLTFNLNHGPESANPMGQDKRVRAAFEKSIDRAVINQVVFEGGYVPSNQTEAPGSKYWNPAIPVPARDLEGAKRLMRESGQTKVTFSMIIGTDPVSAQVGQVIQSMAAEAGFDVKLLAQDGATMVAAARGGNFQSTLSIWSGRPDPDGNASIWMSCAGFLNWGQYCNKEMDENLAKGAAQNDPVARRESYRRVSEIMAEDRANIVLYHFTYLWGLGDKVQGVTAMPDGILRPAGVRLVN